MTPEDIQILEEVKDELILNEHDERFDLIKLIWDLEAIIEKYKSSNDPKEEYWNDF